MMDSLSDYNNNPGNLRPPKGITYDGQIGVDDKGFAVFQNKEYGRKALVNDLSYKLRHGVNTPEKFVDKYAPAGKENDEESRENYKLFLASQFGLNSTSDTFPEDGAEKLANAVGAFEGGTWNKPEEDTSKKEKPYTVPELPKDGESVIADQDKTSEEADTTISKPILGTAGAQLGAGTTASIETAKKIRPLVTGILAGRGQGPEVKAAQPATRYSMQRYLNSQLPDNIKLTLSDLEKITGKKIRTMSEVQQALKAIQEVKVERTAKPVSVDPRTGMQRKIYSTTPGRPAYDLSAFETKPSGPIRQALAREATAGGEFVKSVAPSAGRITLGALGGAGAAMSAYDANELYKKIQSDREKGVVHPTVKIAGIDTGYTEDELRLRSKLMSTAGGALGVLPFGVTQLGGLALSAPELAWSGYEMYKNRDQTPKPAAAPTSSGIQPAGGIPMADFSGLP